MLAIALASILLLGPVTPSPIVLAPAAPSPDIVYTFRSRASGDGSHDDSLSGTVRLHGDAERIDFNGKSSDSDPGAYILVLDGGTRMISVHPSRHKAEEISATTFERIVGTSLRAVRPLVRFTVRDITITPERLGAGGTILGYATEHARLSEHFTVHITAMGFDGGDETVSVVNDYWVSPGLDLGRNPVLALVERAATATAQSDASFVRQEDAARAALLRGTPLRSISTVTTIDDKGKRKTVVRTTEVTALRREAQPASLFEVPSGYAVSGGAAGE